MNGRVCFVLLFLCSSMIFSCAYEKERIVSKNVFTAKEKEIAKIKHKLVLGKDGRYYCHKILDNGQTAEEPALPDMCVSSYGVSIGEDGKKYCFRRNVFAQHYGDKVHDDLCFFGYDLRVDEKGKNRCFRSNGYGDVYGEPVPNRLCKKIARR